MLSSASPWREELGGPILSSTNRPPGLALCRQGERGPFYPMPNQDNTDGQTSMLWTVDDYRARCAKQGE